MTNPATGRTQMFARGLRALALAAKGFRVFPLRVGGKLPAIARWPELATTDAAQIRVWWSRLDYNIGVACGRPLGATDPVLWLIVFDYDSKGNKIGHVARAAHVEAGWGTTMVVKTPNGYHHYYLADRHISNSQSRVAEHVDVKSHRGYVVGVGSTVDGVDYQLVETRMPALLPAGLMELALRPGDKSSEKVVYLNETVGEIDSGARDRAGEELADQLGTGGNRGVGRRSGDAECRA